MFRKPLSEACEKLGVHNDQLEGVAVLLLPENLGVSQSKDDLRDAGDTMMLAKAMKESGIICRTAFDLGARPKIVDRRGDDIWLGIVWILNTVAAPTVVQFLANWLTARYATNTDGKQDDQQATIHVELRLQDGDKTSTIDFTGSVSHFHSVLEGLRHKRRIEQRLPMTRKRLRTPS